MRALPEKTDSYELTSQERQFQRVDLTLFGRYMLANRQEFPCQVLNMSPGSVALMTPKSGAVGERVVAYVDHIGRLEGVVLRHFDGGFAMSVQATERKRDKLAAKLTWLANKNELKLPEDRRHERIVPRQRNAEARLEDGRAYRTLDVRPAIGTVVWLGNMRGRVVRHFEDGVAIEFAVVQTRDSLERFLIGMPD
jgi:hypothetical protein